MNTNDPSKVIKINETNIQEKPIIPVPEFDEDDVTGKVLNVRQNGDLPVSEQIRQKVLAEKTFVADEEKVISNNEIAARAIRRILE